MPLGLDNSSTNIASDHGVGNERRSIAITAILSLALAAQAIQTACLVAAKVLNYDWASQVGSVEKGKYADIIAVKGDVLRHIDLLQNVGIVIKKGKRYK